MRIVCAWLGMGAAVLAGAAVAAPSGAVLRCVQVVQAAQPDGQGRSLPRMQCAPVAAQGQDVKGGALSGTGVVAYADGAVDRAGFPRSVAQPGKEARARMGSAVVMFLCVCVGVCYVAMRRVWARLR